MTLEFSRVRFILTEPSHPGNVGSSARAVKNMGFEDLWLVAPKTTNMACDEQAIALASGATDILENTQSTPTLEQALAPITLSFALTARARDLGPPTSARRLSSPANTSGRTHRTALPLSWVASGLA